MVQALCRLAQNQKTDEKKRWKSNLKCCSMLWNTVFRYVLKQNPNKIWRKNKKSTKKKRENTNLKCCFHALKHRFPVCFEAKSQQKFWRKTRNSTKKKAKHQSWKVVSMLWNTVFRCVLKQNPKNFPKSNIGGTLCLTSEFDLKIVAKQGGVCCEGGGVVATNTIDLKTALSDKCISTLTSQHLETEILPEKENSRCWVLGLQSVE